MGSTRSSQPGRRCQRRAASAAAGTVACFLKTQSGPQIAASSPRTPGRHSAPAGRTDATLTTVWYVPKFEWLNRLKASTMGMKRTRSFTVKVLESRRSTRLIWWPTSESRFTILYPGPSMAASHWKASRSMATSPGTAGPSRPWRRRDSGSPSPGNSGPIRNGKTRSARIPHFQAYDRRDGQGIGLVVRRNRPLVRQVELVVRIVERTGGRILQVRERVGGRRREGLREAVRARPRGGRRRCDPAAVGVVKFRIPAKLGFGPPCRARVGVVAGDRVVEQVGVGADPVVIDPPVDVIGGQAPAPVQSGARRRCSSAANKGCWTCGPSG